MALLSTAVAIYILLLVQCDLSSLYTIDLNVTALNVLPFHSNVSLPARMQSVALQVSQGLQVFPRPGAILRHRGTGNAASARRYHHDVTETIMTRPACPVLDIYVKFDLH